MNVLSIFKWSNLRMLALIVLVFMYVYSFDVGSFHSQKLAVLTLFLWAFTADRFKIRISWNSLRKIYARWIIILILLSLHMCFLYLLLGSDQGYLTDNSSMLLWTLAYFLVIHVVAFYSLLRLVRDENELLKILLIVTLVQLTIIVMCMNNDGFRVFVDRTFNATNYWNVMRDAERMFEDGYTYGIGCMTSTGVMQLSLGMIACCYYYLRSTNKIFVLLLTVMAVISAYVARTGVVIFVIVAFFCFFDLSKDKKKFFLMGICLGLVLMTISLEELFLVVETYAPVRVTRLFTGGFERFFEQYFGGSYSTEFFDVLLGTGITSGVSETGVVVHTDGGFLKNYSAMGLPVVLAFYLSTFSLIVKNIRMLWYDDNLKRVGLLFFVILLIGEFKEPFIFGYFINLFFVFFYLANRSAVKMNRIQ